MRVVLSPSPPSKFFHFSLWRNFLGVNSVKQVRGGAYLFLGKVWRNVLQCLICASICPPCRGMVVRWDRGWWWLKRNWGYCFEFRWEVHWRGVSKVGGTWGSLIIKVWCMLISNAWFANLVNQLHNSWHGTILENASLLLLNFLINEWLYKISPV